MAGAGLQAAGTSSAGFGVSEEGNPQDGVIFQGLKGNSNGSRYIDQRTRDFVIDENGRATGMPNVPHLVQMAVTMEKNSSTIRGLGQELKKLDRITTNFQKRVLGVLTAALQHLIDAKLVEVIGFSDFKSSQTDKGLQPGQIYGRLLWRDLTTQIEHSQAI